jgi:hypothetical protein
MVLTTHPLLAQGQERVELYLYPPSGPSGLLRGNFTFTYLAAVPQFVLYDCNYIQGDSGGQVNILEDDTIGHFTKNKQFI